MRGWRSLAVIAATLLWLGPAPGGGEALSAGEPAGPFPYDETADAAADIETALAAARQTNRLVLLNFGANWCADCRAFARATDDPELAAIIGDRFVFVKIDVGNWDRNPDVVDEWGNPIAEGIPALVVASPAGEILFTTRRGQVSSASRMSRDELADFFRLLAEVADDRGGSAAGEPDPA